jgi:hypothetical protein
MKVAINCPQCQHRLKLKPELLGKKVKCRCGAIMRLPRSLDQNAPQSVAKSDPYTATALKPAPAPQPNPIPPANTPSAQGVSAPVDNLYGLPPISSDDPFDVDDLPPLAAAPAPATTYQQQPAAQPVNQQQPAAQPVNQQQPAAQPVNQQQPAAQPVNQQFQTAAQSPMAQLPPPVVNPAPSQPQAIPSFQAPATHPDMAQAQQPMPTQAQALFLHQQYPAQPNPATTAANPYAGQSQSARPGRKNEDELLAPYLEDQSWREPSESESFEGGLVNGGIIGGIFLILLGVILFSVIWILGYIWPYALVLVVLGIISFIKGAIDLACR